MKRFFGAVFLLLNISVFCFGQDRNVQIIGGKKFRYGKALIDDRLEGKYAYSGLLKVGVKPNVRNLFSQTFQDEVTIIGGMSEYKGKMFSDAIIIISPITARNLGINYQAGQANDGNYYVLVEDIQAENDIPPPAAPPPAVAEPVVAAEKPPEKPVEIPVELPIVEQEKPIEIPVELPVYVPEIVEMPVMPPIFMNNPKRPISIIIHSYIINQERPPETEKISQTAEYTDYPDDGIAWLELLTLDDNKGADTAEISKMYSIQAGVFRDDAVIKGIVNNLEEAGFKVICEEIESYGLFLTKISVIDIPEEDIMAAKQFLEYMRYTQAIIQDNVKDKLLK